MPSPPRDPDFAAVVDEARALQAHLPWLRLVCVGGTAAALHAGHRFSLDADHVGPEVRAHFDAVRQQRRRVPLAVTRLDELWVPTPEETLRVKAWMVADRGATRDYVDVAALGDLLGAESTAAALAPLSELYEPVGTETATMRFAQAAFARPTDELEVDLRAYRGLTHPYRDLEYVTRRVQGNRRAGTGARTRRRVSRSWTARIAHRR